MVKETISGDKESGFRPNGDWVALKDVKPRNNMIKCSFKEY